MSNPLPPNFPPNLKAYERAARVFCQKSGLNPEVSVRMAHPTLEGVWVEVKQWELTAERMYDLSLLLTSLKEAGERQIVVAASETRKDH